MFFQFCHQFQNPSCTDCTQALLHLYQVQFDIEPFLLKNKCGFCFPFNSWYDQCRASKSCRRADTCLHKIFKNLRKVCMFERKIRKPGIKKLHNLAKFFKSLHVLWHFKPIPLRKIYKICLRQNFQSENFLAPKNLLLEGLDQCMLLLPSFLN